jgi:hypothetical protein
MIVGVAIILFGATYPLWQVDRSSWGHYSIPGELPGENGNPIGVLGLYFTTNTLFSVSNTVHVQATFTPLYPAPLHDYRGLYPCSRGLLL